VFTEPGKHEVTLEHADPLAYREVYELMAGSDPVYVKIFRRVASNGLEVVDEMPGNFGKTFMEYSPLTKCPTSFATAHSDAPRRCRCAPVGVA
jgi:hypothetical protein